MGGKIFWAIVIGCLLGVFLRSTLPLGVSFAGALLVLAASATCFGYFERRNWQATVILAIGLVACAGGIARMESATLQGDPVLNSLIGEAVVVEGMVMQEPDARETSTLVSVRARTLVASSTTPVFGGILARLPAHANVAYGDTVQVSGTLELPEAFDTGEGRQFHYPEYLAVQGIGYTIGFAQLYVVEHGGNPIRASAFRIKEAYVEGMRSVLPEPEAGLASGITVGDKRSIGKELSIVFQRDSLVHMVVLSGYNITIVLNAIAFMLQKLPRLAQFSGSIGVVLFFILMSGGAASATRAGLMALIAVYARATHRTYLGTRALAAVAFLMVVWNPLVLAFDPGFQLSALATLGLVLLTPIFAAWFSRVPERLGAREILASTCATQLMVLPLLLYQNGTLSLVSLPANLLALAPVPFAMLFSFIAALAGMLLGSFGSVFALPAYALLWYIIAVAKAFAALPFAAVTLGAFSFAWVVASYALLFGGWIVLRNRYVDAEAVDGDA